MPALTPRLRPRAAFVAALAMVALTLPALAAPVEAQQPFPVEPPIPFDPPWWPVTGEARLDTFEVDAEIRDGVIEATYRLVLSNPGWDDRFRPGDVRPVAPEAEGRIVMPVPPGSSVSDLVLSGGPETLEGKVLDADEAQRIYEEIVRRRIDPALLRSIGDDLFEVRAFPVPAGETRTVTFVVTSPLEVADGAARFELPWSRMSPRPASALVHIEVDVPWEVRGTFAPGFELDRDRRGPGELTLDWESPASWIPDRDFTLDLTGGEGLLDTRLLAHRAGNEDGYFALLLTPEIEVDEAVARDVVLVLDTSGSMEGDKIVQARDAATYILDRLGPDDRFGVVAFARRVEPFEDRLRPSRDADDAIEWVQDLDAGGGTNFAGGIEAALDLLDGSRPSTVIVLTDGLPTVGITDGDAILEVARDLAPTRTQLFAFGVGYDVDTVLLDAIAREFTGTSHYVRPEERVDAEVGRLYERIATPVLTDVRIEVDGVNVYDLAPATVGGLFADQQLVLSGRYEDPRNGGGDATVTVMGDGPEGRVRLAYEVEFPRRAAASEVAQMWAQRFIADLLTELRLSGPDPELIEEIVAVATQFGIVTPYTSYLAEEPNLALAPQAAAEALDSAARSAPSTGAQAFGGAADVESLREGALAGGEFATTVRRIGAHSFYLVDGRWTQDGYEDERATEVAVGSEAFADLVALDPEVAAAAALGERVLLEVDGDWFEVVWPDTEAASEVGTLPIALAADLDRGAGGTLVAPAPALDTIDSASSNPPLGAIAAVGLGVALLAGGLAAARLRRGRGVE
ncbi:MAG: VWA domain-containing protein [Dehalococcoidia bacterium]